MTDRQEFELIRSKQNVEDYEMMYLDAEHANTPEALEFIRETFDEEGFKFLTLLRGDGYGTVIEETRLDLDAPIWLTHGDDGHEKHILDDCHDSGERKFLKDVAAEMLAENVAEAVRNYTELSEVRIISTK